MCVNCLHGLLLHDIYAEQAWPSLAVRCTSAPSNFDLKSKIIRSVGPSQWLLLPSLVSLSNFFREVQNLRARVKCFFQCAGIRNDLVTIERYCRHGKC